MKKTKNSRVQEKVAKTKKMSKPGAKKHSRGLLTRSNHNQRGRSKGPVGEKEKKVGRMPGAKSTSAAARRRKGGGRRETHALRESLGIKAKYDMGGSTTNRNPKATITGKEEFRRESQKVIKGKLEKRPGRGKKKGLQKEDISIKNLCRENWPS